MRSALKKLNFFVEEDVRQELERLIPSGQRAKIINEALRRELLKLKREKVTEKLMAMKSKGVLMTGQEIVTTLRKDRSR